MNRTPRLARIAAVGAVGALGALVPIGAAAAAPYPNGGTPEVSPQQLQRANQPSSGTGAQVEGAQVEGAQAARAQTLPFTGGDLAELAAIGAVGVGVGVVLVRRSRRVRAASPQA
jgi:hypothetical protein